MLCDPYTLLGMAAIWPMLEAVNVLMEYAQSREVFVCDFIAAIVVLEGQLYAFYEDPKTAFSSYEFWAFRKLTTFTHDTIQLNWITDLNDQTEQLAFIVNGEKLFAKHTLPGSVVAKPVDKDMWEQIISGVKAECAGNILY